MKNLADWTKESHLEQEIPFNDQSMVTRGNFQAGVGLGPSNKPMSRVNRFHIVSFLPFCPFFFLKMDLEHPSEGTFANDPCVGKNNATRFVVSVK